MFVSFQIVFHKDESSLLILKFISLNTEDSPRQKKKK